MLGRTGATKAGKQLATALRAGDGIRAKSLADRSGIPEALLRQWELGPWGTVDRDTAALALSCVAALAEDTPVPAAWLSDPDVIGLVADMVELVAPEGGEHPWLHGITALDG